MNHCNIERQDDWYGTGEPTRPVPERRYPTDTRPIPIGVSVGPTWLDGVDAIRRV